MSFSQFFLKRSSTLVILLTIIGAILHFYNLNWGAPFYFHPDERNIASSVSQLQFPDQMHPHFFAYGTLPIYVIYFTGLLTNLLNTNHQSLITNFEQAIIISRFYSALFATALIPILYLIGKKLKDETTGLIAAFLATTSVGFIQFSHFGTFEMWLTFFGVLLFWICLQKITKKNLLLMGILFGILVATKISSLVFFPVILLPLFFRNNQKIQSIGKISRSNLLNILIFLKNAIGILLIGFIIYYLTNPFVFSDTKSFLESMKYESSLAIGTLPVFYTGEFFNTIPIIFQFLNIYPFLLNPLITILFIPSFIYLCWKMIKTKNYAFMILASFFMILFLSQAFLFAKWTRYMIPTLPFIYLIIALALVSLRKFQKTQKISTYLIIITSSLFAISYFITAFVRPDTRVAAYQFAQKIIPFEAPMLSEVYDLGIVPFNASFRNISLFNFYELDNNSPDVTPEALQKQLTSADYIILPSQRIINPRLKNSEKFPQGNAFYTNLIHGNLGYQKIYETPCDSFCKITYLGDPTSRFEQTANVFDRPTVMIFKKSNTVYTKE